jgi:hypothetical protein
MHQMLQMQPAELRAIEAPSSCSYLMQLKQRKQVNQLGLSRVIRQWLRRSFEEEEEDVTNEALLVWDC